MRIAGLLVLAACGRGAAPPASAPTPASAVSPTMADPAPASATDVVVAKVGGHPVYASCVEAQAAHGHLDANAALDECVAFELLAQEAERRGLRADLDVADAWRRELVRGVIVEDLRRLETFDDLPPELLKAVKFEAEQKPFLHRPDMRAAWYVRAPVPKNTVLGSPVDDQAKALADAIYAEVAGRDDVTAPELIAIGERVAKDRGDPPPFHEAKPKITPQESGVVRAAVKEFRDALYALPAIGTVHAPVRTAWGYDIILWHDTVPGEDLTEQIFEADVRSYFIPWSDAIARELGVTTSIDDARLATLAEPSP